VPPASPDVPDARAAIESVLEPLRAESDRVDQAMADNRAYLEERRKTRVDAETRGLLERAATSPGAPDSLRRVARQVARGQITWDSVFDHRAGPEGEAFLADAFRTAREHFADADLTPVPVPEEALAEGVDPEAVDDDIELTLREAGEAHDRIFRATFSDDPPARGESS
jgi:hypothetical protein